MIPRVLADGLQETNTIFSEDKVQIELNTFFETRKNCDSQIDFSDGSIRTCRNKKNKISTIFVGTDSRANRQMRNHLL